MLKFKVDENLPVETAEFLVNAGHDALTVADQQMAGEDDPKLALVCQQEGRAIITLDLDFSDIRVYPPSQYAGIIVLRLARQDKAWIIKVVQRLIALLMQEELTGKLWIVDESIVRVRN